MRSWRELVVAACVAAAGACTTSSGDPPGDDGGDDTSCDTSYLTYDNFGEPFMENWCRSCHSSEVPEDMRQTAPDDVNFDDLADVQAFADRIAYRAGEQKTMPPAGGPSDEERALLVEWISCGAK
jgi:uncharacterized membrane protein